MTTDFSHQTMLNDLYRERYEDKPYPHDVMDYDGRLWRLSQESNLWEWELSLSQEGKGVKVTLGRHQIVVELCDERDALMAMVRANCRLTDRQFQQFVALKS